MKNNLGPDQTGLAFRISPESVETRQGWDVETSAVRWLPGEVSTTPSEILAAARGGDIDKTGALAEAKAFLMDLLGKRPGPQQGSQATSDFGRTCLVNRSAR